MGPGTIKKDTRPDHNEFESSRVLQYLSSSVLADQQEIEQSYQDPLTLNIADDDDDVQPEYDYINTENDQQPMIKLTQCPAYRSTAQQVKIS